MKTSSYVFCLLATLILSNQSFSQQATPGTAGKAAVPYLWVKVADAKKPARAIPYGSQVLPNDPNVRSETAVARGAYVSSTATLKYLAYSNGRGCSAWMINNRSRQGREMQLKDCELMVPAPGYSIEWRTIDEQKLRRMTDEQIRKMGAVKLEILLSGRGNYSGFITRIKSQQGNIAATFYGRLAHLPPKIPRRLVQVDATREIEGPTQVLLFKQNSATGAGSNGPAPKPPQ